MCQYSIIVDWDISYSQLIQISESCSCSMLSHSQSQPFKFIITTLKKLVDSKNVEKEQNQLRSCLKSITEINHLVPILNLLIDSQSFQQLFQVLTRVFAVLLTDHQQSKNVTNYEKVALSPGKSCHIAKGTSPKQEKISELTPSTKKPRVFNTPALCQVIEELVGNLQKFDEIKINSKHIKLSVQRVFDELFGQDTLDIEPLDEAEFEQVWTRLWQLPLDQTEQALTRQWSCLSHYSDLIWLLQEIQKINKLMQGLKSTTNQILNQLDPNSCSDLDAGSQDSCNLEGISKNPSEHRSLLTQMLRDSSQNSNLELPENEYTSQIVLRPRLKEYSQNEPLAHLDSEFKFSFKSAKPHQKQYHRPIRSEMNYWSPQNNYNDSPAQVPITRRKQIKIKRSEISCSRCEMF